jgi:tellurite resistance protein TehA-like permease
MSSRARDNVEANNDRSPLLGARSDVNGRGRDPNTPKWKHILEHKITWAWYNVVIASGGIALVLNSLPYRIHRFWIVGAIVYIFSLILFFLTLVTHLVRFIVRPGLIPASVMHPNEGMFISTLPAAMGVLILDAAMYSVKMHHYNFQAMAAFYWIFVVLALVFGIGSPLAHYARSSPEHSTSRIFINTDLHTSVAEGDGSQHITPTSLTSFLPLLLAGPAASAVVAHLPEHCSHHQQHAAMGIVSSGVILQGMGILLTLLYQSSIITKLQTVGYKMLRPALFLTVVGPALTSFAATIIAQKAAVAAPHDPATPQAGMAIHHIGIGVGLAFWGLAAWWYVVSTAAMVSKVSEVTEQPNRFMQIFNVIFAHVALFLASNELLRAFGWPKGLSILNEIFGLGTVVVWVFVMLGLGYGIVSGKLMRD